MALTTASRIAGLFPTIGIVLLVPLYCWGATDDDEYLRQIETEAKRQAATPITNNNASTPSQPEVTGRLPLGLQQKNFEESLRNQVAGTYAFYQQLSAEQKRQIFEIYQRDNRISVIREQTIRLLSGGSP